MGLNVSVTNFGDRFLLALWHGDTATKEPFAIVADTQARRFLGRVIAAGGTVVDRTGAHLLG